MPSTDPDLKSLIAELQGFGLTQPQIAAICGCAQSTISDLASGTTKDPRHSLGKKLEALAEQCRAGNVPGKAAAEWDGIERRNPARAAQ